MIRIDRARRYAAALAAGITPAEVLGETTDAVVLTGSDLALPGPVISYANPAFERLTGYTAHSLLGSSPRRLQGYNTERAELERMKATLLAGGEFEGEVVNYDARQREYVIGWTVVPIRAGARLDGYLSVQNDVFQDVRDGR